jgi:tripartite-type tricarboxylate transporter receptor subunit TctC
MPQSGLADIVAAAKANPGSITVATAGVGTGQHLVAAAFMKAAGFHRSAGGPYRSVLRFDRGGPAVRAVGTG